MVHPGMNSDNMHVRQRNYRSPASAFYMGPKVWHELFAANAVLHVNITHVHYVEAAASKNAAYYVMLGWKAELRDNVKRMRYIRTHTNVGDLP
jgi:hypothetical protein